MKKWLSLFLVCWGLTSSWIGASAQDMESPAFHLSDDHMPVVVLLHDGEETSKLVNVLLIVIDRSTGKAMKATLRSTLFPADDFNPKEKNTIAALLQDMEAQLQIPLPHYVCIGLNAFNSMEQGEAKEKSVWDLIEVGFSLLGSVETNLSITQTISVFRQAFSQMESGFDIMLPGDSDTLYQPDGTIDWEKIREELYRAINQL